MKRYAKFGYAAPFRFRVILEKPQGGGGKMTPPPTRAKVKAQNRLLILIIILTSICAKLSEFSCYVPHFTYKNIFEHKKWAQSQALLTLHTGWKIMLKTCFRLRGL